MFDQTMYKTLLDCAFNILRDNMQQLSPEFCEGFMFDHDLRHGNKAYSNAQQFTDFVARAVHQINGGQNATIRDNNQLFSIVGSYIDRLFTMWSSQRRPSFGGGTAFGGSSQIGGFGGGGMRPQQVGFGQASGLGFGQQQSRGPGAHLADDFIPPRSQQPAPSRPGSDVIPPSSPSSPFASTSVSIPLKEDAVMSIFATNPMDNFPEGEVTIHEVPSNGWGSDDPKSRLFSIVHSFDYKTNEAKYVYNITHSRAVLVFDDPFEVAKKFFKVVPDSLLVKNFFFDIEYDHVEKIRMPTQDFLKAKAIAQSWDGAGAFKRSLHTEIISFAETLSHGSWVSLSAYLVGHINRLLYLKCRNPESLTTFVRIHELHDLDELFSAEFRSSIISEHSDRDKIRHIVNECIKGALEVCATPMFADDGDFEWGFKVIKSSEAFSEYEENLYPSKLDIPLSKDFGFDEFVMNFKDKELSRNTYILTRRTVCITNALGQKVLPLLGKDPVFVTGTIPSILSKYSIENTRSSVRGMTEIHSERMGNAPLTDFYNTKDKEEWYSAPSVSTVCYMDRVIFAIQYKTNPKTYLTALDVFSNLNGPYTGKAVIAKHPIETLRVM